jgi:signal transduction histidine kinase
MANEYKSGKTLRYLFTFTAVIIAAVSIWITNSLVSELKEEERKKMEIWSEAVALMSSQALLEDLDNAGAFDNYTAHLLKIIQNNTTIPTILTDEQGNFLDSSNLPFLSRSDSLSVKSKIKSFGKKHAPIVIQLDEATTQHIFYDDSTLLKQLRLFPVIQLTVVFAFILIAFLALNSAQRAEQNKVWVGLSKETAHQLGTPLSSLMAWLEYLTTKNIDPSLLREMDKDIQRLKTIAERFSKIGSPADPEPMDLTTTIMRAVDYMAIRISSKVTITTHMPQHPVTLLMNESLFGWTLENLIKNAVDAMDGQGEINISASVRGKKIIVDVTDTGKGIPKSRFDSVFHPGYTTKKRGWGLGLSLAKRIVESYQKGKIYVYKSELGKGTTFRMEL